MKKGSYRKVNFEMQQASGYNSYYITSIYHGKKIKIHTNNSEAWDWLDDDSDKEKYNEARRFCYCQIVQEFERIEFE